MRAVLACSSLLISRKSKRCAPFSCGFPACSLFAKAKGSAPFSRGFLASLPSPFWTFASLRSRTEHAKQLVSACDRTSGYPLLFRPEEPCFTQKRTWTFASLCSRTGTRNNRKYKRTTECQAIPGLFLSAEKSVRFNALGAFGTVGNVVARPRHLVWQPGFEGV
jgi:hypothetical protein